MAYSTSGVKSWFRILYNNTNNHNRYLSEEVRGNIGWMKGRVERGDSLDSQEKNAWNYYQARNRNVAAVMKDYKKMLPALFAEKDRQGKLFRSSELDMRHQVMGKPVEESENGKGSEPVVKAGMPGGNIVRWSLLAAGGFVIWQMVRS